MKNGTVKEAALKTPFFPYFCRLIMMIWIKMLVIKSSVAKSMPVIQDRYAK